jgi:hypothetical protein
MTGATIKNAPLLFRSHFYNTQRYNLFYSHKFTLNEHNVLGEVTPWGVTLHLAAHRLTALSQLL